MSTTTSHVTHENPEKSPLGKTVSYINKYAPGLLFPIARQSKRDEIGIASGLPFQGHDLWNAYELSWLNSKGKPIVAMAQFSFPCTSPSLIESKSFKLYLNSFNQTVIEATQKHNEASALLANGFQNVQETLSQDLSNAVSVPVSVKLIPLQQESLIIQPWQGTYIDDLDIECNAYQTTPDYLLTEGNTIVSETLCSNLLKSNCLVTGQPDWGSVRIEYTGKKINQAGLLRYIVSFREHNEFHEQCVERIFVDIMRHCNPEKLTVEACYTRRGGLDINPIRSTEPVQDPFKFTRLLRQ